MKGLLSILIWSAFFLIATGQAPDSLNYQAVVHDTAGEIVSSKSVSIRFNILRGSITGETVYSEKHKTTTSSSGLVSLYVGTGNEKTGNIKSINWIEDSYFLKVEVDPAGGDNFTNMGITQLLIITDILPQYTDEKTSSLVEEDELTVLRRYVGKFIDYRHTGPFADEGPNLIWIKTSMEKIYGKISAYGRSCKFSVGDNLYIKRLLYTTGGISGRWIYQIENDSSVYYRLTDLQYDKKIFIGTWF